MEGNYKHRVVDALLERKLMVKGPRLMIKGSLLLSVSAHGGVTKCDTLKGRCLQRCRHQPFFVPLFTCPLEDEMRE